MITRRKEIYEKQFHKQYQEHLRFDNTNGTTTERFQGIMRSTNDSRFIAYEI